MRTQLDEELIEEFNLQHLPIAKQEAQLQQFYDALEMKIGMALEDSLSDEQLQEFEKVSDVGDDEATQSWLRQAVPEFEQIVTQETENLKREIKNTASEFKTIIKEKQ